MDATSDSHASRRTGTGKTTVAWVVSNIVDPSPGGAVISMPIGEEQWAVAAKNS